MRIASGVTDQYIYFVAVDSTDLKTRETGLSSFTVYRSRNGGSATAYTTPTIAELSSSNMPGVYSLLLDEDMTIDSGDAEQEVCLHITQASMAPVTRVFTLFRPPVSAGETLTVTSGRGNADVTHIATAAVSTSTAQLGVNVVQAAGTAWGSGAITAASIASNAITSAKIATDAIGAAQIADNAIDAGAIATGAITSAKFAAGAIDAAAIAADAIGSSELAASAITEIQAGLSTLDAAGVRSAVGLASANLDTQLNAIDDFLDTEVAAIKAKTDNLPSDPADASVIAGRFDTVDAAIAALPTADVSTDVTAIKAKTDSLTFTQAGQVDANIQYVNDVEVTGVGSDADPWGP